MPKRVLKKSWWQSHGVRFAGLYVLLIVTLLLVLGVNNKASTNRKLSEQARDIACVAYEEDCTADQVERLITKRRTTLCRTIQRNQRKTRNDYVEQQRMTKTLLGKERYDKLLKQFGFTAEQAKELYKKRLESLKPDDCATILGVDPKPKT